MKRFFRLLGIACTFVILLAEIANAGQFYADGNMLFADMVMLHTALGQDMPGGKEKAFLEDQKTEKAEHNTCILADRSLKVKFGYIPEKQVYVTAENGLHIRQESGTESAVIASVGFAEGLIVDGVSTDKQWLHVKTGGYVAGRYVSDEKPRAPESKKGRKKALESQDPAEQEQTGHDGRLVCLGTFRLTFYCNCGICAGEWAGGRTAIGTYPAAGRTIAVDPDVIPLGSIVYINGNEYRAEDTGSSITGSRIDIYMNDHQAALDRGVEYAEVYIER